MPGPAAVLREIHRLKRFAKDLQARIDRDPRQIKAQQNALAKQEEGYKQAQDALKKLKVQVHEDEVLLKSKQEQVKKYERQQNTATNKKEYDALKHEIETTKNEIQTLEDSILERLGTIEEKTAELPKLEKALQQAKADLAAFERDSAPRIAALEQERQRVLAELAEVVKTVPDGIRDQYERIVKRMGEDSFAAVEGQSCMACYTEITAQRLFDLKRESFLVCTSCGRMLYPAETKAQ